MPKTSISKADASSRPPGVKKTGSKKEPPPKYINDWKGCEHATCSTCEQTTGQSDRNSPAHHLLEWIRFFEKQCKKNKKNEYKAPLW